jgi:hypothetical protein
MQDVKCNPWEGLWSNAPLIPFIVFGPYGILFSKVLCDLLKDCHWNIIIKWLRSQA